jgi:hypothetical protein
LFDFFNTNLILKSNGLIFFFQKTDLFSRGNPREKKQ